MNQFLQPVLVVRDRTSRDTRRRFQLQWTIEDFSSYRKITAYQYSAGVTMAELGMEAYAGRWRVCVVPLHKPVTPKTEPPVMDTKGSAQPASSVLAPPTYYEAVLQPEDLQGTDNSKKPEPPRTALPPTEPVEPESETQEQKYVSVYLCFSDPKTAYKKYSGELGCFVQYKTSVFTGKLMETPVASCPVSRPVKFTNTTTLWGSTKVVTHDRLFGVDKVPGIIKNDCITVIIDVTLFEEPETVRVSETTNKQSPAIYEAFLQRQLQMLCSEQHRQAADFTLYSNDGNDFHVNRFFLMAHSPFFAALLTGDSPEKRQAKYEFPDLDGNSVEIMLGYLYGSYVDKIHSGNAEKVLDMADKYQVTGLRVVCEKAMAENINAGNVVEYQVLARQKNLDVLMNAAFQFIANYQSVHSKGSK